LTKCGKNLNLEVLDDVEQDENIRSKIEILTSPSIGGMILIKTRHFFKRTSKQCKQIINRNGKIKAKQKKFVSEALSGLKYVTYISSSS